MSRQLIASGSYGRRNLGKSRPRNTAQKQETTRGLHRGYYPQLSPPFGRLHERLTKPQLQSLGFSLGTLR